MVSRDDALKRHTSGLWDRRAALPLQVREGLWEPGRMVVMAEDHGQVGKPAVLSLASLSSWTARLSLAVPRAAAADSDPAGRCGDRGQRRALVRDHK